MLNVIRAGCFACTLGLTATSLYAAPIAPPRTATVENGMVQKVHRRHHHHRHFRHYRRHRHFRFFVAPVYGFGHWHGHHHHHHGHH